MEYPEIGKPYKHYKGGIYEVITMANHSETEEPLVIYKSLLFGGVYARPLEMWFEYVNDDKSQRVQRFSLITA